MLKLINYTHQLLIQYQALMANTSSAILPQKAKSKGAESTSKASKGQKKKKHEEKPN